MDNALSITFELFINILQAFVFIGFCRTFFERKYSKKISTLIFSLAVFIFFSTITYLNFVYTVFTAYEIYILCAIQILYSLIALKGNLLLRVFLPVFSMTLYYGISSAAAFLVGAFSQTSIELIMTEYGFQHYLCIALVNVTFILTLYIILCFRNRRYTINNWSEWVTFISVPFISIITLILILLMALDTNMTQQFMVFLGLISICIVLISVIIWVMLLRINKAHELKLQNALLKSSQEYYRENILQVNESLNEISSLRHDMKNKLFTIGELISLGETEEAKEICGDAVMEIESRPRLINSANVTINAVLNVKFALAAENNIETKAVVSDSLEGINSLDLVIILANIIDNAIEASKRIDADKRYIEVSIGSKGNHYTIIVRNKIAKSVLDENPNLETSKDDKKQHGIGVSNVRKIVEKYNGILEYFERDELFCCGILLEKPLKSVENQEKVTNFHT